MPVNRDVIYYDEWETSINRWRVRLEIIPAGDFSTLPTTFERLRRSVISIKGAGTSFEDFALGAWKAPTQQVEIDLEFCPDNLRLLLQDPIYLAYGTTPVTNRFMLYSDRGNGSLAFEDWPVEFAGVQPISMGSKRTVNAKTLKPKRMTVELFDLGAIIFQEYTSQRFCGAAIADLTPVTIRQLLDIETPSLQSYSYFIKSDGTNGLLHLYSLLEIFNAWQYSLEYVDIPNWTRADIGDDTFGANGTLLDAVQFYAQDNTAAHLKGSALTDVLVVGMVTNGVSTEAAERLGGMLIANSGGAEYREYTTIYDLLSDAAKCFWLKLRWKYSRYTQNTTNDNVKINLYWSRRLDNYLGVGYSTVDITRAIGDITLEDCSNVVRTGETELPNVAEDDVDKRVVETGGLRNAATWNVKALHYNHPSYAKVDSGSFSGVHYYNVEGLALRCLYYADGSIIRKVHESVRIYDKDGVSTLYEDIIAPSSSSKQDYNKWVGNTQAGNTGIGYATAKHATTVFGKLNQSRLEITLAMDAATRLLPCNVGEMYNLNALDGEVSSTEWTLLEAEADWLAGSMKCVFISKGI